jgi:hypothetical protein
MRLRDFCHKLLLDRVGGAEITRKAGQKKNVSTRLLSQIDARSGDRVGSRAHRVFYIERCVLIEGSKPFCSLSSSRDIDPKAA